MDRESSMVARRAAARLGESGEPRLPPLVEAVLAGGDVTGPQQRFLEPGTAIALASLVVSVAGLAWQIYWDLRQAGQAAPPAREVLARQVRVRVEVPPGLTPADRDRVVEVVVDETIAAADDRPQ